MTRSPILIALALGLAPAPALAAHKYLPPLTGLVPGDFVLGESAAPWLPEQLPSKSLAVVVSGNLDVSIADWRRLYGSAKPDSAQAAIGKAIDPSIFVRRAIALLRPRFATLTVVPDLATARRQKADYVAILDYDMTYRTQMLKTYQVFRGGLTMVDARIARVFTVEATSEVRSNEPGAFKLDFGSVDAEATAAAFTKVSDDVAAGIDARLR